MRSESLEIAPRESPWFGFLAAALAAVGLAVAGAALAGLPSKRLSEEERGDETFHKHCVQCHGKGVAGDGPAARSLVATVPDLRTVLDASGREKHAALVIEGRGPMPSFDATMDREAARCAIRHMEKLASGEIDPNRRDKPPTRKGKPIGPPWKGVDEVPGEAGGLPEGSPGVPEGEPGVGADPGEAVDPGPGPGGTPEPIHERDLPDVPGAAEERHEGAAGETE